MGNANQQMGLQGKLKGVADVVFVLDVSGSMAGVIEAVKQHIGDFVDGIRTAGNNVLDIRLGLVAHEVEGRVEAFDFTSDPAEFRRTLAAVPNGGNEWGLPAIDRALDFPWRNKCRRFLVVFSDEPVSGGSDPSLQVARLDDLCQKIVALNVKGYLMAPVCAHYDQIGNLPGWIRQVVEHDGLGSHDYAKLLNDLGRTVSQTQPADAQGTPPKNIYGFPR